MEKALLVPVCGAAGGIRKRCCKSGIQFERNGGAVCDAEAAVGIAAAGRRILALVRVASWVRGAALETT
jgi:hypothetical protein